MTPKTSTPFAAARSATDHGLTAFAAALLLSVVLSAGAFLPRLGAPAGQGDAAAASTPAYAAAEQAPAKRG